MATLNVGILEATLRLKDAMSSKLNNAAKKMRKFGGNMQRAGSQMTKSFTLPLVAAAFAAVKSADTIDKALRTVAVGTGATGAALEGLGKSFENVLKTVPETADAVGQAIADINTITGLTGKNLELFTKDVFDAARAMGDDAAPMAADFSRALVQFQVPAERAREVFGTFFQISQQTGMSLTKLTQAFKKGGADMSTFGFTIEQTANLFGLLDKSGIKATQAIAPMATAFDLWTSSGKDARVELLNTIAALELSDDAAQKNAIAFEIFGSQAGKIVTAIDSGAISVEKLTASLDVNESAVQDATEGTETFGEILGVLKNQASIALAPFGRELKKALTSFLPTIEKVGDKLSEMAKWFAALDPKYQKMILGTAAVVAALGPILLAFGALSLSVGQLIPIFTAVGTWFFGTATAAGALAGALAFLVTWPGVLTVAIALLLLKFKPFRDLMISIGNFILTVTVVAFQKLGDGIKWIGDKIVAFVQFIAGLIPGLSGLGGMMDGLSSTFDALTASIGGSQTMTIETTTAVEELTESVDSNTASTEIATAATDAYTAGLALLNTGASTASPTIESLGHRFDESREAMAASVVAMRTLGLSLEQTRNIAKGLTSEGLLPSTSGLAAMNLKSEEARERLKNLADAGYILNPVMLETADRAGGIRAALEKAGGSASAFGKSWSGLISGITGGEGIKGLFDNLGSGVVDGFGAVISGGLSSMIAMGVGLAMKGLSKLGGWIKSKFGPDEEELEGRDLVKDFEDGIIGVLNTQQLAEAGGRRWAKVVIGVRDAYVKAGRGAKEGEDAVQRLWDAIKTGGPEAVKAVISDIKKVQAQAELVAETTTETTKALVGSVSDTQKAAANCVARVTIDTTVEMAKAHKDLAGKAAAAADLARQKYESALEKIALATDDETRKAAEMHVALALQALVAAEDVEKGYTEALTAIVKQTEKAIKTDAVKAHVDAGREAAKAADLARQKYEDALEKVSQVTDDETRKQAEMHAALALQALVAAEDLEKGYSNALDDIKKKMDEVPKTLPIAVDYSVPTLHIPKPPPVRIPVFYDIDEGGEMFPSYQTGTHGRYEDFGRGTLAMLHGREKITPIAQAGRDDRRGGNDDAILRELGGLRSDLRNLPLHIRDAILLAN